MFRSAVSGRFVSFWYALTHPRTTVKEDDPRKKRPRPADKMRTRGENK